MQFDTKIEEIWMFVSTLNTIVLNLYSSAQCGEDCKGDEVRWKFTAVHIASSVEKGWFI